MPLEIEHLIKSCKNKDRSAQEKLYRDYYGYAMSICMPYSKDKTEAEEVANDAFMKVFNNINRYDENFSFKSWLRKIMINTAIDNYRKNKKYHNQIDLEYVQKFDGFDNYIIDKMSADEIMGIVQGLSPAYKIVFNLYVLEGYKHHEIAKQLNISEGTSKSNLSKAKNKLKEQLELMNIKPKENGRL
ncbi:MAG: sigma-70 family RNA polymerase sigma factor [Cyclobacteriaceae bacterium]